MADTKFELILGMSFLKISNVDVVFGEGTLTWKLYTTNKALPTTERVRLVDPKEFVIAALDADSKTFVVHVAIREREEMPVHFERQAQFEAEAHIDAQGQSGAQVGALLFDKALTEVPAEYFDNNNVFLAENAAELPENTGMNEHTIELEKGKQPLFGPIYSLGPVELETLKTYIETNLANGFIGPSKFPAGAPILFNKKPDGSLHLCVDYRDFNNITIKNRYPLPLIGESLDRLGRVKQFTQLDLTNAYHRMRIREGDKWKTTFRTQYGYFEYQVMPFSLSNAPATFQGYVNKILAEKLDLFVIVYLDDILIYIKDPSLPHVEAVRWILGQLRKYSLFTNLKKCHFHQDEDCFLGYVVSSKGINIEAEQIEVVKKWPKLKSIRDIQVFLDFAKFYQQFIQGFSRIVGPLTLMLKTAAPPESSTLEKVDDGESGDSVNGDGIKIAKKSGKSKGQKISKSQKSSKSEKNPSKSGDSPNFGATESGASFLTPKARSPFNRLWLAFTKAPILCHFNPECHIWIKIDALGYTIGGMLSQLTSGTSSDGVVTKANLGQWYSVTFFSRKMIPAETWYKTHNSELLAIIEVFKTWCHYLEGCKHEVLVLTDHNNLRHFMDMKSLSSRQVR